MTVLVGHFLRLAPGQALSDAFDSLLLIFDFDSRRGSCGDSRPRLSNPIRMVAEGF